jgi:hypothetical protein
MKVNIVTQYETIKKMGCYRLCKPIHNCLDLERKCK